jgi:hypothetical protein
MKDIILSKLASPGDRPSIKSINAKREDILSLVGGNQGISATCEATIGNTIDGLVYREIRDIVGPTRVEYVAYWQKTADMKPTLKQFLSSLQPHSK